MKNIDNLDIRLIGHDFSLFSGKARAYLRHKKIPFVESARPEDRALIQDRVGRHVVPVVTLNNGDCIQDTTKIIDYFEAKYSARSVYPDGPLQKLVSLLFEVYGDEWLVIPAMHYRWYYKKANFAYVLRNFGEIIAPHWPKPLRVLRGLPIAMAFGNLYKPLMGCTRQNIGEIERSYESFLKDFNHHLEDNNYLLGNRVSIGDFGLIGPLYAHLYKDPYPGELMKKLAPNVVSWVERMQNPEQFDGEFPENDKIPETLYPLLKRIFDEQFPVLIDTISRVEQWSTKNPDRTDIPRFIGRHKFSIGGVSANRFVMPFAQWMFQRPLDHYQSLNAKEREGIDSILNKLGGFVGISTIPMVRLKFEDYKISLDK